MAYSNEYFRIGPAHFLFLVPGNLPDPSPEGSTFETQVRRFVGPAPPPSFVDFPESPAPPSGQHILHPFASWHCVRYGVRFQARHFATPEPTSEPETWVIPVTVYPIAPSASPSAAPQGPAAMVGATAPRTASASASSSAATPEQNELLEADHSPTSSPSPPLPPTGPTRGLSAAAPGPVLRHYPSSGGPPVVPQAPGHRGVDWVTYVDVLPPLQRGEFYETSNTELFRPQERMVYRLTTVPRAEREEVWELLHTGGLPCEIVGQGTIVDVELCGEEHSLHLLSPLGLPDGPGRLIMHSRPNFALQPLAALGESSYMINGFVVCFRSSATGEETLWFPRAQALEYPFEDFFLPLAQIVSMQTAAGQAASQQPQRKIVYARKPQSDGERRVHGMGVRLFDGGLRLELEDSPDGQASILKVPGETWAIKAYGTFTTTLDSSIIRVRLDIPPSDQPQDIILRVTNDITKVKYALRPREGDGCARAIARDEWKLLRPPNGREVAPQWVECYFVNLRRVSRGCLEKHLLKPAGANDGAAAAAAAGASASASGSTSTSRPATRH